MSSIKLFSFLFLLTLLVSCNQGKEPVFQKEEISAWCIKGFDVLERNAEQRIEMLKEMGIHTYGYNKGKGDISEMIKEFNLAKENDIDINAVFLWLNPKSDSIGKLSPANQELLDKLKVVEQKPAIWVSFSESYFENKDDTESLKLCIDMLNSIKQQTDSLGCKLALYNHHGWFGDMNNQIRILEQMDTENISIVYNFHHGQNDVDNFQQIAKDILPYLSYVNISGVSKDGPRIITFGEGDHEFEMIEILLENGYKGPWGILGHVKTEDVQVVLDRNIAGLNKFNSSYSAKR